MSGESLIHTKLVEYLIKHVRENHRPPSGLLILADHHAFGRDRPHQIEGYTPDLYASDLPCTFEILGEAKTPNDLKTDRSARQIAAFLDHLSYRPNSRFYLAVPAFSKTYAKTLLRGIIREEHKAVTVEIIDGV